MDSKHARTLQAVLADSTWVTHTRVFAGALRRSVDTPGTLLMVGTPTEEPWHLTAHLSDEAELAGIPELAPVLVRHSVPPGAAPHLSVDLSRLEAARRGETLFVVAPDAVGAGLLERVDDARRHGATVFALEADNPDLRGIAHEALSVAGNAGDREPEPPTRGRMVLRPDGLFVPANAAEAFETAQHLISVASTEAVAPRSAGRGFRDRLGRLLDVVSGPDRG